MNNRTLATGLALAIGSTAMAGTEFSTASINVDVLAVNGTPEMTTGTVNTITVEPGDTILFAINGTLNMPFDGDFISFAVINLLPVGAFGTVDEDSITVAEPLGDLIPVPGGIVYGPEGSMDPNEVNGLELNTLNIFAGGGDELGTSGQLFTFEFTVADSATEGFFRYDQLDTSGADNRLSGPTPDINKYLIVENTSDTIVIPAPSAAACFAVLGLAGATRRRRA